jgi:hypothetical protein
MNARATTDACVCVSEKRTRSEHCEVVVGPFSPQEKEQ